MTAEDMAALTQETVDIAQGLGAKVISTCRPEASWRPGQPSFEQMSTWRWSWARLWPAVRAILG